MLLGPVRGDQPDSVQIPHSTDVLRYSLLPDTLVPNRNPERLTDRSPEPNDNSETGPTVDWRGNVPGVVET